MKKIVKDCEEKDTEIKLLKKNLKKAKEDRDTLRFKNDFALIDFETI